MLNNLATDNTRMLILLIREISRKILFEISQIQNIERFKQNANRKAAFKELAYKIQPPLNNAMLNKFT